MTAEPGFPASPPSERVRSSQLVRATTAVVLAGGRGTRLAGLTNRRCKPAVPFGGKFRIIDFTLSNCVNSGIRQIGVTTQYNAQSLIRHLQRGWSFLDGRFGEYINLLPAQQKVGDNWYRGTADSVYQNLDVLRRDRPDFVLVVAGDHIYKMDYARMLERHVESRADLTVACVEVPRADATAFGVMEIAADGRILSFEEKPAEPKPVPGRPDRALASMGIYVFNAAFLYEQLIRDADDPASAHDFGRNIVPHAVARYRAYAHDFAESSVGRSQAGGPYWRDVGTVDAFWEANLELTRVTPELNLYDEDWPIWTWQEQVPPAKFVFDDDGRRGMAVDSMIAGGSIVSGAVVRRSLLFTRVSVEAGSEVEDSVVLHGVRIGSGAKLRRVVLDRGCAIPDGLRIGYDREEDARRFHVSPGGVVLVTPEMLGQDVHAIR